MSSCRRLSLVDILQETDQVTDWFSLGVFLKMPSTQLKDIERRFTDEGLQRCKIELFSSWLERDPDASWELIALALEKCNQNATADRIRQSVKCSSVKCRTLFPPSSSQSRAIDASAVVKRVVLEEVKVAEFRNIERSYARLASNLKISLIKKHLPILNIQYFLEDLLELNDGELSQASTIGELFQLISPHYCFLNTAILGDIIDEFIGEPLKQQLNEYERQLKCFKESTSIALLKEIGPQCSPSAEAPQVIIKLANCWLEVTIKRFQRFVEQIFKKSSTVLANIRVETGCICVAWLARRSAIPSLITQALENAEFMRLVGVMRLSVAGIVFLEQEEEEDTFLSSALLRATYVDCVNAVEMLLYFRVDTNASTESGLTPLMIACLKAEDIRIATLLLQAHADINQQDTDGFTALMLACCSETPRIDLVKLLIQYGADMNIKNSELQRTALMIAAKRGHTSIVQLLLQEGAPVNTQDMEGFTALTLASQFGHSEVVCVLINYKADVNTLTKDPSATPLIVACNHQRTACVDLLLAGGANPNLCGRRYSPLIAACITDHNQPMDPTIIEKLLSAGANPNTQTAEYGSTALMHAAYYGYERGVQALLNASTNVNIQNLDGDTALHYAIEEGQSVVCKMLLASDAQTSLANKNFITPLDLALHCGHHKVCEIFSSSTGSDPTATLPITVETKPVEDLTQPHKIHLNTIKPRRGILSSITSIGQYFRDFFLPNRSVKKHYHSNQTQ